MLKPFFACFILSRTLRLPSVTCCIMFRMTESTKSNNLSTQASQEEREAYKDQAVEIRESGDLTTALEMFKDIIAWDEANDNLRGKIDVMGHLRITLTRLAEAEEDQEAKDKYREEALKTVEEAMNLAEEDPNIPEGTKTIQKVHYVNVLHDAGKDTEALEVVNQALENFPGTAAHKAWPANAKAQIQASLGDVEGALATLEQGERWLFEGYAEEFARNDQPEIKINVWLAGIHLTKARIYEKEGRHILARHYANSVLQIDDPTNCLGERKKEAQRIMANLGNL